MVPAAKIIETAKTEGADIIGLSGLITPSLDEMSFLAGEMERNGMKMPLLIGGATTSRVHTAVKIDPNYKGGPVVHVNDASRAVGVASSLLSPEKKDAFAADIRAEYARISAAHFRAQADKKRLTLEAARANAVPVDFSRVPPKEPSFLGIRSFDDYDLAELADYIDWTPFFQTWELTGRYPAILDDNKVGSEARKLFADAKAMLDRIVREKWFTANAVVGFWPANAVGDDIEVYADPAGRERVAVLHQLRQQKVKPAGQPNLCLADFVAPKETGVEDWAGAFAVCAGGFEQRLAEYEAKHDDYGAIMLKVLADRLAEAFAEHLHERVRREFWGYAPDERLAPEALIAEAYRGIRPAPGYPACPDHTAKGPLFALLGAEANAGMRLTESYAMLPASAVAGFYFSHPEARYFAVGRIGRDQVEDYARRAGLPVAEAERWLAPNLAYEPADIMAGVTK